MKILWKILFKPIVVALVTTILEVAVEKIRKYSEDYEKEIPYEKK